MKAISWIGVIPWQITGIDGETEVARTTNSNGRERSVKTILKDTSHRHAGRALPGGSSVEQVQVVGCVAEDKLVEQGGGKRGGQTRHHTDSGSLQCAANCRYA